jgi:glyoxylase-like metal-dependent hydrolase (beta-lactamase superfamily II)
VRVDELAPGLWRWVTAHPEWREGADWDAGVGCVYWEAPDAVVLIDPLVPAEPGEAERFWQALDRDVERLGRPVVVAVTTPWHRRSDAEVAARYGGAVVEPGGALPGAIAAFPAADEVVLWLPGPRAVVPGDVLLGDGRGGARVCPASWLPDGTTPAAVADALAALRELPVELLLVSHGEPVLTDAAGALAAALDGAR